MQSKKILAIALVVAFAATFAFAFVADGSDADASDVAKTKDPEWGKFTDTSSGHFYVYLENKTDAAITVKVVVYDGVSGDEKDTTVKELAANSGEVEVRMTFGYGSDGSKIVNYKVYNNETEELYFADGSFELSVSHSIWKNTSTYVIIVVVIIAIVVIAYFVMRSRATKQKSAGGTKTFTQLEAERKAKKAGKVAEKQDYKASGSKKKRN